ncbi:ribonuclease H-like YkuK family protein [Olivibacter sitiensis]|uniref:ribonuclease H-like YkuK family protein n=1 Tax=Olivibacter sitiensis TaxID=376470 RepID=UPI00040D2B79|nr:ribonuclease H-like YkuK family protein [Olivibacter sitiensis]
MSWKKFSGEPIRQPLIEEVGNAIAREYNLGNKLKVCIGTDSQVKGAITDFATVIAFVREKKGGFMYIHQDKTPIKMSIKERMLAEVQRSIETAYALCDLLDRYQVELEVHADINTNPMFKSNQALHEAMGYILSMGFVFKAKPEAFASSACANKVVQ